MSRSRRDLFVTLAAAGIVLTGCVSPHKPGVSIDTLDADIVFGLAPPAAPASPPGVPQFAPAAQTAAAPEEPPGPPDIQLPALLSGPKTNPVVLAACPTARQGAFPDLTAGEKISGTPAPGVYRWKPGPPQLFGQDKFAVTPDQFILKAIGNVSPVTQSTGVDFTGSSPTPTQTSTFTYDVVTARPDGTSAKDSFKVEQNSTRAAVGTNVGPIIRTGDPSRGVSLTRHEEYDAKGQRTSSFAPPASSPGLLLLPVDVVSSEQFQSVATDETTGATYTIKGVVNKRSSVDACGTEVDGWEVDAETSFTYALPGPNGTTNGTVTQTANYTYFVATQLGGILTYEKVVPLQSVATPPSGTAADGVVPPSSTVPANPLPANPYEIGLGSAGPFKA